MGGRTGTRPGNKRDFQQGRIVTEPRRRDLRRTPEINLHCLVALAVGHNVHHCCKQASRASAAIFAACLPDTAPLANSTFSRSGKLVNMPSTPSVSRFRMSVALFTV